MLGKKCQLAQIIALRICRELTENMDYKGLKLKYEASREDRANMQAIEYTHDTVDQLRYLDTLQPEGTTIDRTISVDCVEKTREFGLGRRRGTIVSHKNSCSHRSSKRMIRNFRENQKGMVKLTGDEDDEESFTQYIEKLRQKKIKFAEVMEEFNRDGREKETAKQFRSTLRETNHTDRPFITTFTGEPVKCQKKEQNSKRDDLYLQKIRIRPLFKLREHVSSRADLSKKGEMPTQPRRVSICNQVKDENYTPKDDNYYIKSIIDVIANRKQLGNIRRRKGNVR